MAYESHISIKSERSSVQGELGIQQVSMRPRGTELSAFRQQWPSVNGQASALETVALYDNVALAPRLYSGRIPGIRRKPPHAITNPTARVAWVSQAAGFSEPFVWSALRTLDMIQAPG